MQVEGRRRRQPAGSPRLHLGARSFLTTPAHTIRSQRASSAAVRPCVREGLRRGLAAHSPPRAHMPNGSICAPSGVIRVLPRPTARGHTCWRPNNQSAHTQGSARPDRNYKAELAIAANINRVRKVHKRRIAASRLEPPWRDGRNWPHRPGSRSKYIGSLPNTGQLPIRVSSTSTYRTVAPAGPVTGVHHVH
jgi:hypothetical protein